MPIQAVRLTLGAVLKWTFSKLPVSNMGHGGCRHNWRMLRSGRTLECS